MLVVMLLTFSSTTIARLGTDAAHLSMEIGTTCHQTGAQVTSIGTITTELDALRHHLHHVAT